MLSWVLDFGQHKVFAATAVPSWLQRWVCFRKVQIATWELVAAIVGVWHLLGIMASKFSDFEIHLFVDNDVALATLLRGASRQKDWNELVAGLWFQTASQGVQLLGFRVPSDQNLADAPTRPLKKQRELQLMKDEGFVEVHWHWPEDAPWVQPDV